MFYLITDQENKTWQNVVWGKNISHETKNPNHHFFAYKSPHVATYMYPFYEETKNPKIWKSNGNPYIIKQNPKEPPIEFFTPIRTEFSSLTSIEEIQINIPTTEQRITFGILCSVNLVLNQSFKDWAIKYLSGYDQTKETTSNISEKMININTTEYVACTHAVFASILLNNPDIFATSAAYRAYHDAPSLNTNLDLEQLAEITNNLTPLEISKII